MKKIQLIVFILLGTVIPGICSENPESGAAGRNPVFAQFNEISVTCPMAGPPYSYKDNDGEVKGSVIDLWRLWSEKTGIKISFMPAPVKEGMDQVCAGNADAFALHVPLENEVSCLEDVVPLGQDYGYVFRHKNISGPETLQDLKGFRIGVVKGTVHEAFIRKNMPDAVLEVFSNNRAMLEAARRKEILVFLNMLQINLSLLKKYGLETEFLFDTQNPLYTVTGYIAVKKGNTAIIEVVKQGMNLITADERAATERKWLDRSFVKTEDTFVISFPTGFSPFMFLNAEGKPAGMFADIWRLWAQKTGKKIEFLTADTWQTGIEYIRNGRADIHGGLFYSPEQYEGIGFSQPFYESGVSIFFSLTYGKISQIAELSGQSIGVVRGTSQELYLKKYHPEIRVSEFGTRDEMIYAARDGKTKGFISIAGLALSDLSRLGLSGEFDRLPENLYTGRFCAGVRKENKELLDLVDKGFDAISDKEFAEIEKRWIPDPEKRYFKPDMKKIRLTAKEESWLRQHKTVRFGFVEGAEPVSYYENNEYKGLHTDYLRLISERTGIRFEYVSVIQAEFDLRAKAYEFDMFPSFNVPQRKSYSDFTNPIMEMTSVIITRSDEQFISSISVLKGKKIAVLKGFGLNKPLFDKHPEIRLIQKETMLEALKEVSDFKADAAILPTISACWLIQKHRLVNLRIAGIADHPPEPYMYGIRKEYPELLSIINKGIDSITKEEHEAILQKWFTVKVEHKADWTEMWHWFLGISGFFTGILLISFLWNRRLAREIRERNRAESELKELYKIINLSPTIVFLWKNAEEWPVEFVSENVLQFGYSREEFYSGKIKYADIIHPEDLKRVMEDVLFHTQEKHKDFSQEYRLITKTGQVRWTSDYTWVRENAENQITHYQGIVTDITERRQAEQLLRESEEKYRYLTESVNDVIWTLDVETLRFTYISPSVKKLRGYTPEEIMAEPMDAALTPEHGAHVRKLLETRLENKNINEPYFDELQQPCKDGSLVWTEAVTRYQRNPNTKRIEVHGVTRNITDRKKVEENLRKSEERFRAIFDNSAFPIALSNVQGQWIQVNQAFASLLHYSADELMQLSNQQITYEEDIEKTNSYISALIRGETDHCRVEKRYIRRDGQAVWTDLAISVLRNQQGEPEAFIGVGADISERKLTEKYLKRNEARLESLLRISQYKTGNIKELLDYALDEAIALTGSRIGYIYYYSEERREFTLNSWSKDVIKECRITKPYTLYHLDRTGVWGEAVRQRKSIIINDFQAPHPMIKGYPEGHAALHRFMTVPVIVEDKIQAVVGVANKASDYDDKDARQLILMMDSVWNIAERRKGEEELKKAKAAAEAANKAKSAFLAGMSHELRTPLNGILGYAHILKDAPSLSDHHRKGVTIIEKSGTHLLSLLNDILDLAKVESGKIELTESIFHFPDMIRTVNSMIEVRAERKGISYCYEEISSEEKGKMPVCLHGDEKHLIQVLVNLLGNAVKFTEKGSITLKTENRGTEQGEGFVLRVLGFEIRDTGIGMTEEDLGKLFRPFQQVGDKKYHAGGTGLGLVISKTLVELMGGKLDVSSQYGSGTVFSFELKLRDAEEKKENQPQNIRKILGYKGKKHRILIADDKEFNRHVFSDLLSPLGFEISDAENGEDGLEKAREFPPDLIVTDLMMPGMDGIEFIRNIRQSPELRHIPIIASSASVYAQDRQNSLAAGADEFLEKPMDIGIFMEQLHRLLHLEWVYEEKPSGDIAAECLPSEEVLENIYVLATLGDIGGLEKSLTLLEDSVESSGTFTEKIKKLLAEFDTEAIAETVKQYLTAPADSPDEKNRDIDISASLGKLPEAWRAELLTATHLCSPDNAERVIKRIREQDPRLAHALEKLMDEFRFEILQNLLEKSGSRTLHTDSPEL